MKITNIPFFINLDLENQNNIDELFEIFNSNKEMKFKRFEIAILYGETEELSAQTINKIRSFASKILIAENVKLAPLCEVDGLYIEQDLNKLQKIRQEEINKIIGFGFVKNKHMAMQAGEIGADFLLFGKLTMDNCPYAQPRNVELAKWWTEVAVIPTVLQAGSDVDEIKKLRNTGVEFIAIDKMLANSFDKKEILSYIINS